MAKRKYIKMELTQLGIELENVVFSGSVSNAPMRVNKVDVDPYVNGFAEEPDGLTKISFD
ncbi:MAG: hypothetical protein MJY84_00895 [Bacteroidales bacterium]|nr:hypothetical protein [Bacteroidales bacterium]